MQEMRAYTTGLSFRHFPRNERKQLRYKLRNILHEISDENLQVCQQHSREVIRQVTNKTFLSQTILDDIPQFGGNKGKFNINSLMTACNDARNHIHSGFHLLNSSAKGFVDRVKKFQSILKWMLKEEPVELPMWVFWTRSTHAIHTFRKKWGLSFHYLDPLMRGVHHKFFADNLPEILPEISLQDFRTELKGKIREMQALKAPKDGEKSFLQTLLTLDKIITKDPSKFDFSQVPSGWDNLKNWVAEYNLPKYGLGRWSSVFRTVFARCYLPVYGRMLETGEIRDITSGKIEELFTIPFENTDEKKYLPYKVVSGPEYVIKREKHENSLKLLRSQGYFSLRFKSLKDRWKKAIELRVIASRKIRRLIQKKVELKSIIILPPREPSWDVDVQLVFEGEAEDFVATEHLKHKLELDPRQQVAVDINRMGQYALVSSFNLPIPDEICKIEQRWRKVDAEIDSQNQLLANPPRDYKVRAYELQLQMLYRRRANLRKTYHQKLANWLGQHLVSCGAQTLILEDLEVHTYGTRKALARAITSMADDMVLYAREVLAVQIYDGRECSIHTLPAFNSSRLHVGCGGILKRSKNHYDIAPCTRCKKMVNTHYNAALYLEAQFLKLDYKVCLSTVQAYNWN